MDARRYLDRIGFEAEPEVGVETLRELHRLHQLAVPFENLDIHLGTPIVLEPEALFAKIVERRRGGFCYELNGLFGELLQALGFQASLLAASVYMGPLGLGPPLDHLALVVDLGERWIADVGFGRHSVYPLSLDSREPQDDPAGVFRVVDAGDGEVDVVQDEQPVYRLDLRPRRLADFAPTSWWQQTSVDSHFTAGPTCSLMTPDGRVTLADDRLITTEGDTRTERVVEGATERLDLYRTTFGFTLDRLPAPAGERRRQLSAVTPA